MRSAWLACSPTVEPTTLPSAPNTVLLKPLYNYNWVVGFGAALLLYWGLTALSAGRSRVPRHAYADGQ